MIVMNTARQLNQLGIHPGFKKAFAITSFASVFGVIIIGTFWFTRVFMFIWCFATQEMPGSIWPILQTLCYLTVLNLIFTSVTDVHPPIGYIVMNVLE